MGKEGTGRATPLRACQAFAIGNPHTAAPTGFDPCAAIRDPPAATFTRLGLTDQTFSGDRRDDPGTVAAIQAPLTDRSTVLPSWIDLGPPVL